MIDEGEQHYALRLENPLEVLDRFLHRMIAGYIDQPALLVSIHCRLLKRQSGRPSPLISMREPCLWRKCRMGNQVQPDWLHQAPLTTLARCPLANSVRGGRSSVRSTAF